MKFFRNGSVLLQYLEQTCQVGIVMLNKGGNETLPFALSQGKILRCFNIAFPLYPCFRNFPNCLSNKECLSSRCVWHECTLRILQCAYLFTFMDFSSHFSFLYCIVRYVTTISFVHLTTTKQSSATFFPTKFVGIAHGQSPFFCV